MNIFGLTSIDSSLCVFGLNAAWNFIELIFFKSHLGQAAFAVGFVVAVWRSSKEGNFKQVASFIFISLLVFLLFTISSAATPRDNQASKIFQTNTVPLILSYSAQMTDAVQVSLISTIDKNSTNSDFHFINDPFRIQKLSLQANQALYDRIIDNKLRREMEDYIYFEYLPSLHISKGTKAIVKTSADIQDHIDNLLKDSQSIWGKVKDIVSKFKQSSDIDTQIKASIIQAQITPQRQAVWFKWAGFLQSSFPYIQGGANVCLYIFFPFLLLVLLIFPRMILLLRYLEAFVWIKSWILTSAVSYYISLLAAYLQGQNETTANWFWEYPYFSLIEVVLLYLLPVITLITIHQSIQTFNNR